MYRLLLSMKCFEKLAARLEASFRHLQRGKMVDGTMPCPKFCRCWMVLVNVHSCPGVSCLRPFRSFGILWLVQKTSELGQRRGCDRVPGMAASHSGGSTSFPTAGVCWNQVALTTDGRMGQANRHFHVKYGNHLGRHFWTSAIPIRQ